MAGDWIKMRIGLQTCPQIVRISSATNSDRLRTVGALHAVWSIFDMHTQDGVLDGYTAETLDSMIGWPGFCEALAAVGWIEIGEKCLIMPRFSEHNGQSAKRRATDSERKRAERTSANGPQSVRNLSANCPVKTVTREEKRREEYLRKEKQAKETPAGTEDEPKPAADTPPPKPARKRSKAKPEATAEFWLSSVQAASKNPVVISALTDWYAHKLDRQEPYLEGSVAKQLAMARNAVTAYGPQVFASAITRAIANNWSGWDHSLDVLAAQQQRDDAARQQRQQGRDCA